jgi:catechol 2,3-dioxygenase-like lactoylglutathione lyase family enzyme
MTRFDHTVMAVRDLDAAISTYRALGFEVSPGGRHTGLGTYNAVIRFGLDYLELLSVSDRVEAEQGGGLSATTLLDFFEKREGGLVGYALATDDIEQEAERFRRTGLPAQGPFDMQRMRPDRCLLSWSLLVPGNVPWRRPWPFFIHWGVPDEQRLAWEKPGVHANGVVSWAGTSIGVQHLLATVGEGPFEVQLAVGEMNQTRAFFTQRGLPFTSAPTDLSALLLWPDQTVGAPLVLRQQPSR